MNLSRIVDTKPLPIDVVVTGQIVAFGRLNYNMCTLPNVTYNQPISPPSNAITSIYTLTFVFRANLNDKHFSLKCQGYAFLNFVIVFFSLFLGCKSVYILVGMKKAHNAKEECF